MIITKFVNKKPLVLNKEYHARKMQIMQVPALRNKAFCIPLHSLSEQSQFHYQAMSTSQLPEIPSPSTLHVIQSFGDCHWG
jgi:hypothetical protein